MKTLRNNSGFTLIELIIVIIILGVLAGLVTPKLYSWIKDSRVNTVLQNVGMVQQVENSVFLKSGTLDGTSGSTPTANSVTNAIEQYLTNGKKLGDMGLYVSGVDTASQIITLSVNWGASSTTGALNETVAPLNLNDETDFNGKPGYTVNSTSNTVVYSITVK